MSSENLNNTLCRTCLKKNCHMKSILNYIDSSMTLYEILSTCAPIKITKDDGLPQQVCLNCAEEINRVYLFRRLCEKSDATLRALPYTHPHLQDNTKADLTDHENLYFSQNCENTDLLPDTLHENAGVLTCNSSHVEIITKAKSKECTSPNERFEPHYCKLCDEVYSGLIAYKVHITTFHHETFKCEFCTNQFKSKLMLARHKFSQHSEKREVKHDSKQKSSKNKTGIIRKRNLPKTCAICNKTFRFHSHLERHKLIHSGEKPYLCNVCGKGFAQLSYLKIHSFIHTGEKPYKCQMCEKSFTAPGTLVTHIRRHTGERPHICKICGKDFPQSGYLTSHLRIHTGEKPIECKVCHQRFNQRGRLKIHMRIHSGEKPYSCKECGRSFAIKGTLKKHIRTHTGERPYVCSACGQAFAQNGTLATHMKIHRSK